MAGSVLYSIFCDAMILLKPQIVLNRWWDQAEVAFAADAQLDLVQAWTTLHPPSPAERRRMATPGCVKRANDYMVQARLRPQDAVATHAIGKSAERPGHNSDDHSLAHSDENSQQPEGRPLGAEDTPISQSCKREIDPVQTFESKRRRLLAAAPRIQKPIKVQYACQAPHCLKGGEGLRAPIPSAQKRDKVSPSPAPLVV